MKHLIYAWLSLLLAVACATPANERHIYTDDKTGREVWQVSQVDSCLMPYFENQAFTHDDNYAVFKSNRDDGVWKLYASNLKTGEVTKVSDRTVDDAFSIYNTGHEVAFMEDGVLYAVDVRTRAERVLFDANGKVDEKRIIANCLFTNDGDYTVLRACNPDNFTSIYKVRLSTGEVTRLLSSPDGIQHPMINPEHPNLITFVCKPDRRTMWDLSREERARGKLIDTEKGTAVPFVMSDKPYRTTHETWSADGERLFYFEKVHRYSCPDPSKGWEVSIVSIDKDGGDKRQHYINLSHKLAHGTGSSDGRFFVADVDRKGENSLFLLNLETGEAQIVCWPDQTRPCLHRAMSRASTYTRHSAAPASISHSPQTETPRGRRRPLSCR